MLISGIEGFEANHGSSYPVGTQMWDIQKARSGKGYFKCVAHSASTSSMRFALSFPGAALSGYTLGTKTVARFYIRVVTLPSADTELWSVNLSVGNNHGIVLETDGRITPFLSTFGVENRGTPSTMAIAPVTGNDFDKWYRIELTLTETVNVGADDYTVSCTITDPDGESDTVAHAATKNAGGTGVPIFSPTSTVIGGGHNGTCEWDLDDYVWIQASDNDRASAVLPTEDRVAAFFPTGQGALNEWTGDWSLAANALSQQSGITAGSAGLRTTFLHDSVAQAGLGITSIGGIELSAVVTTPTPTITEFLLGGAVAAGSDLSTSAFPAGSSANIHHSSMGAISLATFDAMEWGFQSNHATSTRIDTFVAHVLYAGNAHSTRERSTGGYRHTVVEWTGDGLGATRNITVGWTPHLIMVYPLSAASGLTALIKLGDQPGSMAADNSGNILNTVIQGLTATGFQIKIAANGSGHRYVAFCVRDDGDGIAGRILVHGSGPKKGPDDGITLAFGYGVDIAVNILCLARLVSSGQRYLKHSMMPATAAHQMVGTGTFVTDTITAFGANGFTLGTQANLINSATGYLFFGFSAAAEAIETGIAFGSISPSDPDVQVTLADGFDPYMVWAKGDNSQGLTKRLDEPEYTGLNDNPWPNADGFATTGIRELTPASRTFTITGGTNSGKHLDASPAVTCYWMAWSREAEIGPPTEVSSFPASSVGLIWIEAFLPD